MPRRVDVGVLPALPGSVAHAKVSDVEDKTKQALTKTAGVGAGVAIAAATGGLAVAALAVLPAVAEMLTVLGSGWTKKRAEAWWLAFCENSDLDPAALAAEIESKKDDAHVTETMTASWRAVSDTLTPDVIPALGKLTAEYYRQGKKPDRFFRGVSGLLRDLDSEQYADLQQLVALLVARDNPRIVARIAPWPKGYGGGELSLFVHVGFDEIKALDEAWAAAAEPERRIIETDAPDFGQQKRQGDPRIMLDDGKWLRLASVGGAEWLSLLTAMKHRLLILGPAGDSRQQPQSSDEPSEYRWALDGAVCDRRVLQRIHGLIEPGGSDSEA